MPKRHIVVLSEAERARLHTMIGRGVAPASALTMPASCSRPTRARPARAGPMPRSPWRWRSTRPLWPGSAWARSRPGWTPRSTASRPRAPTAAAWTASRGPPGRAGVQRPAGKGASGGGCGCWPIGWWRWRWSSRCRPRRSGRPCSKPAQAVADRSAGASQPSTTPGSSGRWRTCWPSIPAPMTRFARRSGWTRPAGSCWRRSPRLGRSRLGSRPGKTTSTSATGWATSFGV
jgi:hypothetical protein